MDGTDEKMLQSDLFAHGAVIHGGSPGNRIDAIEEVLRYDHIAVDGRVPR